MILTSKTSCIVGTSKWRVNCEMNLTPNYDSHDNGTFFQLTITEPDCSTVVQAKTDVALTFTEAYS